MAMLRPLAYIGYCLPSCILVACTCAPTGESGGLSLSVECPATMPFEGPCPVTIVVTNVGSQDLRIVALFGGSRLQVTFQEPSGWLLRDDLGRSRGGGYQRSTHLLRPGESIRRTLYLHDFFSRIRPGEATLRVEVALWIEHAGETEEVDLTEDVQLNLPEEGPERLAQRIKVLSSRIAAARFADERLPLYRSVGSLTHPDLIPLFIQALMDRGLDDSFHSTAKSCLVELCEAYDRRQVLIDYLVRHGIRGDQPIFEAWKQAGTPLSEAEILRLSCSANPWVSLTCLEYYWKRHPLLLKGAFESLKNEIMELRSGFDRLAADSRASARSGGVEGQQQAAEPQAAHQAKPDAGPVTPRDPLGPVVLPALCGMALGFAGGVLAARKRSGRGHRP